jgi:hypothetical protein
VGARRGANARIDTGTSSALVGESAAPAGTAKEINGNAADAIADANRRRVLMRDILAESNDGAGAARLSGQQRRVADRLSAIS